MDAVGLALYTQAVLQGAFILAKAKGDVSIARECTAHLKRYFEMLFAKKVKRKKPRGDRK